VGNICANQVISKLVPSLPHGTSYNTFVAIQDREFMQNSLVAGDDDAAVAVGGCGAHFETKSMWKDFKETT